jgi:hypothetical protein
MFQLSLRPTIIGGIRCTGFAFYSLAAACLFLAHAALAAGSGLNGKSVSVTWTEGRMQRLMGESAFRPATRQARLDIYISTVGRPFSRLTMSRHRASGSFEAVSGIVSIRGHTVTAVHRDMLGASRVLVTVAEDYLTCSADVIRGRQQGASSFITSSVISPGTKVEIASVHADGISCSIRAGNVFGNQQ